MRQLAWALTLLVLGGRFAVCADRASLRESGQADEFSVESGQNHDLSDVLRNLASRPDASPQAHAVLAQLVGPENVIEGKLTFARSVLPPLRAELLADLIFVGGIRLSQTSPLHHRQDVFGPGDGTAYLKFFHARIDTIGFDAVDNRPGVVAYVMALFNPHKMLLTQDYIDFQLPQVARVSTLFHEARHSEQEHEFWHHAKCPTPFRDAAGHDIVGHFSGTPFAGQMACDNTPIGSYGLEVIMLKNIQKFCSNCTRSVKREAGVYADEMLKRIVAPAAHEALVTDLYQP